MLPARVRLTAPRRAVALLAAAALLAGCGGADGGDADAPRSPAAAAPGHSAGPAAVTPAPAPLRAGEEFRTLGLPDGAYQPAAAHGGTDDYRCFLLDPGLAAATFVTGVQVLPGNGDVVHHAILFRTPPEQVAAARAADDADDGSGWTCFGGTGLPSTGGGPTAALDSAPWLAGWAPGAPEAVFPTGTGVRLERGSRVVLQMHYNLLAGSGADDTRVRLRLAGAGSRLTPLETMLLPAPVELPCTDQESGHLCQRSTAVLDVMKRFGAEAGRTVAGLQLLCDGDPLRPRAGATQSCDRTVRERTTIWAAAGHMHLLGRSIRLELAPGTADARVLLDRPVWDFDDQGATRLPGPIKAAPGQRLRVTCTHDAGLRARLPELAGQPARYVVWGEGTSDEMCLGILLVSRG